VCGEFVLLVIPVFVTPAVDIAGPSVEAAVVIPLFVPLVMGFACLIIGRLKCSLADCLSDLGGGLTSSRCCYVRYPKLQKSFDFLVHTVPENCHPFSNVLINCCHSSFAVFIMCFHHKEFLSNNVKNSNLI
jgi:hypothetical protein